jgi:hypothetical protein
MYGRPLDEIDWNRVAPDAIPLFGDAESDGVDAGPDRTPGWRPSGFIEWFAVGLTLLPALLFIPGSQAYRLPIRTGAYAISLFALALWWFHRGGQQRTRHPAGAWIGLTLMWVGLMILHPLTGSLLVGLAQFALYVSILCPVFWAQSFVGSRQKLMRTLVVLLLCNGVNSAVGVLQVYDPDRWMPRELSAVYQGAGGQRALAAATYIGPNGRRILRPPGLFDAPGAVAGAGMVATILGLIFCLEPLGLARRGISLAFAMAGMLALYLSHVRAAFVMTLAMMAAYLAMLALQDQKKRALGFGLLGFGMVVVGLSVATTLGGEGISKRFMTLLEGDPRDLYYESRGIQVEAAMTDLVAEYPLGAGLGRWGMLSFYYGGSGRGLFAEVQPHAWMLDGGVPLVALYGLVLIVTLLGDWQLIRSLADPEDRLAATIVVAANVGTIGLVFTFVPFTTAAGMQFWLLEGMLRGAMADRPRI